MNALTQDRVLDAAVVGGGIFGSTLAWQLLKSDQDVVLFEAAARLGGTLGSSHSDGFVWERGANGFLDNVPFTRDLAIDVGLESRLLPAAPAARHRFLLRRGRLVELPEGPAAFLRSPLLSLAGRLRVITEGLRRYRSPEGEESVASFARRHLGSEATEVLIDAMVTGIFGGDAERLSVEAAFPRLVALEREHGSLIRGMIRRRRAARAQGATAGGPGGPGGRLSSFPLGTQELVDALASRLGDRVALESRLTDARRVGEEWQLRFATGETIRAHRLALCIPPHLAAEVLQSDHEVSALLREIPAASIVVVGLGFERDHVRHALTGFGYLRPRREPGRLLGCLFPSVCFPPHAPEGQVSLRAMIGGVRDPEALELSDAEIQRTTLDELRPLLGLRGEPRVVKLQRWPRGIPQYEVGHLGRLARLEEKLNDRPGLALGGNGYRGIGLNDCVREAGSLAESWTGSTHEA